MLLLPGYLLYCSFRFYQDTAAYEADERAKQPIKQRLWRFVWSNEIPAKSGDAANKQGKNQAVDADKILPDFYIIFLLLVSLRCITIPLHIRHRIKLLYVKSFRRYPLLSTAPTLY